jgi:hypothetical protein
MVRSEHYREQADRYARLASFKIDPEIRERLLSLAAEHGAMAEGLARAEQQSKHEAPTFRLGSSAPGF